MVVNLGKTKCQKVKVEVKQKERERYNCTTTIKNPICDIPWQPTIYDVMIIKTKEKGARGTHF